MYMMVGISSNIDTGWVEVRFLFRLLDTPPIKVYHGGRFTCTCMHVMYEVQLLLINNIYNKNGIPCTHICTKHACIANLSSCTKNM